MDPDCLAYARLFVEGNKVNFISFIKLEGKHVIIKLNTKAVVDYAESENVKRPADGPFFLLTLGQ